MKGRMRPPVTDYDYTQTSTSAKPQSPVKNISHQEKPEKPTAGNQQWGSNPNGRNEARTILDNEEETEHKTNQIHKTKEKDYKINPKAIPRPNHFEEIYRNNEKSQIFETNEDQLPPLSTTYYSCREIQNSSSRFIRSSLTKIPTDNSTLNATSLIFGLYAQPFAELPDHEIPVPKTDVTDQIFRCKRCSTYINSKFEMTYSKANKPVLVCNVCSCENELDPTKPYVKNEYYSAVRDGIPELYSPTVDFKAPENMKHKVPFRPHYIFLIDISPLSCELGLPAYVMNSISSNLDFFHNAEGSYITIATYDYKSIQFFTVDKAEDVKLYVVTDIENPFCPLPLSKLMLNVTSQKQEIEKLNERISAYITDRIKDNLTKRVPHGSCTGAAISAGVDTLQENGGRVMAFTCSVCPSGYGATPTRDDHKLFNSQNEKNLYLPQHTSFNPLANNCIEKRIVIDQFIFASNQFDLATFSLLSNLTGGEVHFFPANPKDTHSVKCYFEKLHYTLSRILTRPNYYDVKCMLRYTFGIETMEILGPFNKKLGDGFALAGCNPDYSFAYHLRLSESLKNGQRIHFQLACLYIDNFNERYLRVFNYTVLATNEIAKVFIGTDIDTLTKVTILKEISHLFQMDISTLRESLVNRIVSSFLYYRNQCSSHTPPSQLILPASVKYYPLYLNSFIKKPLLRKNKTGMSSNQVVQLINKFMREPVSTTVRYLYPKFYRIDDIQRDQRYKLKDVDKEFFIENVGMMNERFGVVQKPLLLPLSIDHIDFDCAYMTDDELFGVSSWEEAIHNGVDTLSEENSNDMNIRLLNIIGQLRKDNAGIIQPLRIFFLNDKTYSKVELTSQLIEDKTNDEGLYVDFLCQLHEEIQKKLND